MSFGTQESKGNVRFSFLSIFTRIGQGCIIGMALFVTTDVVLRFIFNSPMFFTSDVAGFLLLIMSFLGLAHAERRGAHVSFSTIVRLWPGKIQAGLARAVWIIEFGWAVVVTLCTYMRVKDIYITQQRSVSTGWLLYPFATIMVLGSILLVLELAGEDRSLLPRFGRRKRISRDKE